MTAVASDAAGNRTVSRLVVVTVANAGAPPPPPPPPSSTLIVPDQFATVQAAIDAAGDGDTVLVRPGTYAGGLVIAGKRITLESEYRRTGDAGLIDRTVLTGGSPVVSIASSAVGVIVDGLTFKSGGKQVRRAVIACRPQQPVRGQRQRRDVVRAHRRHRVRQHLPEYARRLHRR